MTSTCPSDLLVRTPRSRAIQFTSGQETRHLPLHSGSLTVTACFLSSFLFGRPCQNALCWKAQGALGLPMHRAVGREYRTELQTCK